MMSKNDSGIQQQQDHYDRCVCVWSEEVGIAVSFIREKEEPIAPFVETDQKKEIQIDRNCCFFLYPNQKEEYQVSLCVFKVDQA